MQQISPLQMAVGNPYIAGNPVGHSDAFIGRTDVLARAMTMLYAADEHALVLHGQRRIGKTSVLQYLQRQLAESTDFLPVYFDLQSQAGRNMPEILADLLLVLRHTLPVEQTDDNATLPALLDALPANMRLVLLMDEVDVMRSHPPAGFTAFLQSLLSDFTERLKLILVIGHGIEEQGSALQYFLQTLPACPISLLSRAEVSSLVKLSEFNDTLHWPAPAIDEIWRQASGHPLLTQQLCAHVWEAAHESLPQTTPVATPDAVTAVSDEVLEACHNTLEWLWGSLSLQEKLTVALMAELEIDSVTQTELSARLQQRLSPHQPPPAVPHALVTRNLTEPLDDDHTYRLRGGLIRRWLLENKPFRRVQAEFERLTAH